MIKNYSKNDVMAILGLEKEPKTSLVKAFNKLAGLYDAFHIWLKGDYGVYCGGNILATEGDLIVAEKSL